MSALPCRNPHCKSYGKPHPNCRCYSGGGEEALAHGGQVNFCSTGLAHHSDCPYYADGGEVKQKSPGHAVSMAAAHHGLLGLLKNVGRASLAEPEKHNKMLHEARGHWQRLHDPVDAMEEPRKTVGVRLANHLAEGKHDKAAEMLHGHPVMGSMHKSKMADAIRELQEPMMSQEPNAEALKSSMDFMHASHRGESAIDDGVRSILYGKETQLEADEILRESLKKHMQELSSDPEKLLDLSGNLAHYMPGHAAQISFTFARAAEYLNKIKPKPVQLAPMNGEIAPNKVAQAAYDRQVHNVAQPLLILDRVRRGTLLPIDVTTMQMVYPELHQAMLEKTTDLVIGAKAEGKAIPYRQRLGIGILMGQPVDFSMKPEAMRAIMMAQKPSQPQAMGPQKKVGRASDVELKQINQTDSMAETPLESRQIDKKK